MDPNQQMNIFSKDIIYPPKIKLNIFEDLMLPNNMDIIISNHITPKQAAEIINIQKLAWNMVSCSAFFRFRHDGPQRSPNLWDH